MIVKVRVKDGGGLGVGEANGVGLVAGLCDRGVELTWGGELWLMSFGGGYLKSKCSVEGVMVDVVSTNRRGSVGVEF